MNNKFENENEEEKLFTKSASLVEHFMRTLDRISLSLYISKMVRSILYFLFHELSKITLGKIYSFLVGT